MNANQVTPAGKQEYRAAVIVSHLVAVAMLVCLAFALVQLSRRLFPGWQNDYLLFITALVALEAMLAGRAVRDYALLTPEWLLHRLTEWVVLLVALKVLLYLLNNPAQILLDVLEWDERFLESFFTPEYSAVVLVSLFIWLLANQFGNFFLNFEATVEELEAESQGMVVKDRTRLRRSLETVIFGIGILMLILMAFTHAGIELYAPPRVTLRASVLVMLLYFFLGFILLAQSQFFIQRARWYLQNVPASPKIGQRWALYSLLLIGLIAGVVALLPTGYAADFFQWMQFAVGVVLGLVTYLFLVLMTPLLYLMQLLANLFSPGTNLRRDPLTPPIPPPAPVGDPDPVWMIVKSLLFWTVFFGLIFYSFRYYIQQHPAAWERLKQRPGLRWLARLLGWLSKRWRSVNRRVETVVETGMETLRRAAVRQMRLPELTRFGRRLPPRAQVLLLYREMLRWNARNGLPRARNQTPTAYAQALQAVLPAARTEIDAITTRFIEARYTRHEIHPADAEAARESWRRLKQYLSAWLTLTENEEKP